MRDARMSQRLRGVQDQSEVISSPTTVGPGAAEFSRVVP
jgi:hypothetical protein